MGTLDQETLFRRWLAEHAGLLLRVVRSFADGPADVDDLLQEVLLQVWLSLPSFRAEAKETTWLYRVALNTALTWKRREKRHRARHGASELTALVVDPGAGPEQSLANRESVERLYAALRAMSPPKRALMILYLDGMSYAEMAEVIGISESNVGVRLNRIKQELAELLKVPTDVA